MSKETLNKKLAKWAGFKSAKVLRYLTGGNSEEINGWERPDGRLTELRPNFTSSLDACFKWLVPKAIDKIMGEQECSSDVAYAILFKKWLQELELIIPEAALALCKAIEKLIDAESKK